MLNAKFTSWEIMLVESLVAKARSSDRAGFSLLCADNPEACDNYAGLLEALLDKLLAATELRVSKELPQRLRLTAADLRAF